MEDVNAQQIPPQSPSTELKTTDQIFDLLQEKDMNWTQVMQDLVDWADDKYADLPAEAADLLKDYPSFKAIMNAYYVYKTTKP